MRCRNQVAQQGVDTNRQGGGCTDVKTGSFIIVVGICSSRMRLLGTYVAAFWHKMTNSSAADSMCDVVQTSCRYMLLL